MKRHLRSLMDLNAAETQRVLDLAATIKRDPARFRQSLTGRSIALIFAKQSTRTRISFEVGIYQLGAHSVVLSSGGGTGMQMGRGETIHDTAKVLSRFVDAIVIRTFGQDQVEGLAQYGSVPVINALTDMFHPCQALADLLTIREKFGDTRGRRLAYVGAGNNVAHSLLLAGPRAGLDVVIGCPPSLPPSQVVFDRARADATAAGTHVAIVHDAREAVKGADVVYTDTWISMGEEDEAVRLRSILADYAVTPNLMKATGKVASCFMHCLPAHRGEEVHEEVMDGPRSVVFDQAENRIHAQKSVLLLLLGAEPFE